MYRSRISGVGSFLPPKKLTNKDLEKIVETSDEWILERTGISSRRIAEYGVSTTDLALPACQEALKNAGITAQDLDLIIFATVTPDHGMPTCACILQHKLGARNIMAFDIAAVCSGFVYGLTTADFFIRSGQFKHVLVVGAEVLHNFINYEDRTTCILFGDGAGAFVVSQTTENDKNVVLTTHNRALGELGELLIQPAGGSKKPMSIEVIKNKENLVVMKGKEIFKHAVRTMADCCQVVLDQAGLTVKDVDWVVPHQANLRIIEALAKQMEVSMDKVIVAIEDMGNTSAATVPVTFHKGLLSGKIKRGDVVLLTAFGAGITSGAVLLRY